ncbi:MAG: PAS domain S-box protein [Chloroflexi bacterium]|nr:PAS domain S-box protein [Chloroflexota bacterium]
MQTNELDGAIRALEQHQRALAGGSPPAAAPPATESQHLARALRQLRAARRELTQLDASVRSMRDALEKERQRNLDLFEAAADAAIRVDEGARILAINRRTEQMFGYGRDELIGRHIGVLIPERFRAAQEHKLGTYVLAPGERAMGAELELYGLRKDGTEVPVEISIIPEQTSEGLVTTGLIRNITKRQQAAQQAARQADLLRLVTDSLPALIAYLNFDLCYGFANRSYREWFALPDCELGECTMPQVLGPRVFAQIEPFVKRVLRGETVTFERDARHYRTGDPTVLHITYVPDAGAQGEVRGFFVLVHDVTESKRAEEALRETTRELEHRVADLETLLDLVPVGVAIADDASASAIRPNREFARMLRLPQDANASKSAPEGERPEGFRVMSGGVEIDAAAMPMQTAARTGQPALRRQMDVVFDDGTSMSLYGQAAPLFDADGRVRGAIGAFSDVSDMRRIEDELRAANAVKDEFLGLVSHELKTPITTILGNAEVLRKRGMLLDEDDRSGALGDIHDEAQRLNAIVENLLVLARLEAGQRIEREPVLIQRIVDRVAERHTRSFPDRLIKLHRDDTMAPIVGSTMYVEQILANLLSNAEKYSPAHAPIDITVATAGERADVSVCDRGVGIATDELETIFTAFYRSPRTAAQQGFGIGLTVCKRLVEAQGGRMWASPRDGGGTSFTFSLPVASDDAGAAGA